MIVPRFNLGRSGLSLLLEGEIDQRKHNHRSNDHDGGVQQHKEVSDTAPDELENFVRLFRAAATGS
jgi:hypothetical protein